MLTSQDNWGPIASVEQAAHNTQGIEGHFHMAGGSPQVF